MSAWFWVFLIVALLVLGVVALSGIAAWREVRIRQAEVAENLKAALRPKSLLEMLTGAQSAESDDTRGGRLSDRAGVS